MMTKIQVERDALLHDMIPEPNRKGVWNFSNPKNLYLTDAQGDLYLSLMGDHRYASRFHDSTEALILRNAETIARRFQRASILVIDLGPGYPSKTFPIVDALQRHNKQITYWAIDVNEHFGNLARDAIRERGVPASSAKRMLFEDAALALRQSGMPCPRLVIIGLTFMNFQADYILAILSSCMDHDEDACLSAVECSDGVERQHLVDGYCTEKAMRFVFVPMSILGCRSEDVKYDVSFHDGRVEVAFLMVHVPHTLRMHGIREGDKIITAVSYRYTRAQYEHLLQSRFGRNHFDQLGNVVLALSQK